mmetsp:Transcript_5460/g.6315  ORF Transcript_5460/g.6315 Transcript_5460/m.6315 type:complete len:124 (-) Transcript_5460:606-977(-)
MNHFNDNGSGVCAAPVYIPRHCEGYDVGDVRDGFEIPCYRGSEEVDTIAIMIMIVAGIWILYTVLLTLGLLTYWQIMFLYTSRQSLRHFKVFFNLCIFMYPQGQECQEDEAQEVWTGQEGILV